MLKRFTYSKNSGKDIFDIDIKDGLNIVKNHEIFSKISILNNLSGYNTLTNSSDANGDFVEFELKDSERSYFLTIYLDSKVYEFYNDLDVDQTLPNFNIPKIIDSSTWQNVINNNLISIDLSETDKKDINNDVQKKLDEINSKISVLEKEIDDSKEYDKLSEEVITLEKSLESLNNKVGDYEKSTAKLAEIEQKKQNLGIFTNLDFDLFEKDLKTLTTEIKDKTEEIEKNKNEVVKHDYDFKVSKKSPFLLGLFLILDLLISIAISFTAPIQAIIIGIVLAIVILLWYFLTNNTPAHAEKDEPKRDFGIELDLIIKAKNELLKMINCQSEDEFYEKKAELQAYDYETTQLKRIIDANFSNINIADLQKERADLSAKNQEVKSKLSSELLNAKLASDDYLKKRRDLDMLKMERIRTESEKKVTAATEPSREILDVKNDLGLESINIEGNNLSSDSPINLYLGLIANSILSAKDSVFPLILNNPFGLINDEEKVNKILEFFKEKSQFVLHTNTDKYDNFGYLIEIKEEQS